MDNKLSELKKSELKAENRRLLYRYAKVQMRLMEKETEDDLKLEDELEDEILRRMNKF